MKRLLNLAAALLAASLAQAATGPIRVLHLGKDGSESARHAHVLMRDLGRMPSGLITPPTRAW